MGAIRQRRDCPVATSRARQLCGWLVAVAILAHGWLPVLLQAALVTAEPGAHGGGHAHHADHAGAPAQPASHPAPAGKGPECPVLHSAVCLCAVLVKVLPPSGIALPFAAAMARRAGGRFACAKPPRHRSAPFEARAPPVSD